MNINHKLHIITIVPVIIALTAVLYVTQMQYQALSEQALDVFRESVVKHRKEELTNYVSIANGAIKHVIEDEQLPTHIAKERVKKMLYEMRFGEDGYFFSYHYDGTALVLPGQEWRVGENWIELKDKHGVMVIRDLIQAAQSGGGYLNYIFNQPSKGEVAKKLAYAEQVGPWQWMFGTGVYIDDIDEQTAKLNESFADHISRTSMTTLFIGILSVTGVFVAGLYIRVGERKLANSQLRELNQRIFRTQEEECKRVSRELHDGISQTVAATRFALETAQLKLEVGHDASSELDKAINLTQQTVRDIRSISHELHPGILEDYGLGAALNELGNEFSQRTGIEVKLDRLSVRKILSAEISSALYRIAQESLTNIERHSGAKKVNISLSLSSGSLTLEIHDDGHGFDYESYEHSAKPSEGIGLRNMKERLHFYNGQISINSSRTHGTSIIARIPKNQLKYYGDE
ncbi:cache domain-containing protein [Shewanella gelidii]|uniref:Histidine kinase n=1 Tax=Shewanella gelidii TaxID=1642821 RepID=A0A917JK65_9GAMM|nr:cache domain-containing protein [Shewanella gelidii]MCL1096558.1 cache domain-containing protein [Shewanella gelidii]GGI68389.1 histidine kinase [Shewanella gelidii]